jgi:hypothetical protein
VKSLTRVKDKALSSQSCKIKKNGKSPPKIRKLHHKIGCIILMKHAKNQIRSPSILFFYGGSDSSDILMYTGARSENGTNAI